MTLLQRDILKVTKDKIQDYRARAQALKILALLRLQKMILKAEEN